MTKKIEKIDKKIVTLENFDKKVENVDQKIVALSIQNYEKQGSRYSRDLGRPRDSNRLLLPLNKLQIVPIALIRASPEHRLSIS